MAADDPTAAGVEEWRDVPGYVGHYQVSDAGRARSLCHKWGPRPAPKILKQHAGSGRAGHRYVQVGLTDGHRSVHVLVLLAFRGPCPEGQEACHENDDATDNRLVNLRWDTPEANRADARRNGRQPMGESHWKGKNKACPQGHAFTPENTRIDSRDGSRVCRACARAAYHRAKARQVTSRASTPKR